MTRGPRSAPVGALPTTASGGRAVALVACLFAAAAPGCDDAAPASGDAGADLASIGTSDDDGGAVDPPTPGDAGAASALGATVDDTGVTFRVFAPHADAVHLIGAFTSDPAGVPLLAEGKGRFAARVAGAHAGDWYAFVIEVQGQSVTRPDPRARAVDASGRSLVVDPRAYVWSTPPFHAAPVAEQVVYELHVGTFNPPAGKPPGDFASAAERIDHVAALGVNMIELLPPAEWPGTFSWGYNPTLPFAVEHVYGAPDDLRRFVDAAHARGIGVVVDVVHNHYASKTPLWCWEGDCLGPKAGGIYFYTDGRMATPWGPRPDFGRLEVRDYIVDNALLWLTEYRADGLRWDSTVNIRNAGSAVNPDGWKLLRRVNDAVRALPLPKLEVAEDLQGDASITRPTSGGGAGFTTQWDAAFFHPVDDTIIASSDGARSMTAVRDAILHRYNGHLAERVIYTESHDEVANGRKRIPAMISPADPASLDARLRSTLGAAIVMTAPGIPMIFMGQELLEDGWFSDQRPLDWSKATTHAGTLALYRDLIALRRNLAGSTRGLVGEGVRVFHVNDGAKVIAYHRYDKGGPGDDVVVVASFTKKPFPVYDIGLPRTGAWHVRFHSDGKAYGDDYADTPAGVVMASAKGMDGLPARGTVSLGSYEVLILSQ